MDWGGIIAGAMGGGAQAVGQIADSAILRRDQEERDKRSEERAIEGERRRAQLNIDMASQEADRKMKQYAASADKVDDTYKDRKETRDLGSLQSTQASISGDSPSASPEELRALMADEKYRKIYEDAGYIPKQSGSGIIAEKLGIAREVGADPMLRKDLADEYKGQVHQEQTAKANEFKERELSRRESADENRFKTTFMQAQAQLTRAAADAARAEKSGNAQAASDAKVSATQALNSARAAMDDMTKPGLGSIRLKDGVPTGNAEDVELYKELKKLVKNSTTNLNSKFSGGDGDSGDKPKSTPAQSAGAYKKGETKVVASGPNKGKTAVFDGTGWTLK